MTLGIPPLTWIFGGRPDVERSAHKCPEHSNTSPPRASSVAVDRVPVQFGIAQKYVPTK